MSNLKPLVWHKDAKKWQAWGAGISYTICGFDSVINVTINNLVKRDKDEPRSSDSKTFTSYSAALEFVEREHYPHFMSEFVKPMPTWIDVNERLPEEDGLYLALRKGFTFEMGNASDLVPQVSGWNGGRGCFDDDYGNVLITHWMPIPEFSTMQNNKGE